SSVSPHAVRVIYDHERKVIRCSRMSTRISPGTTLGRYEIKTRLGAGGMGEVYLAEDVSLNQRKVALKLLPPEVTENRARLSRFEQEASAASALNHPNILTIYEFGQ